MGVNKATLPASMISNSDGVEILQQLAQNPALTVTLTFTLTPFGISTNGLVSFSSQGPSVDFSLKPDLIAVGSNFYTAAQKFDPNGALYDPSGYTITQGTSFSAPLVSGAVALLKAARPGLTNRAIQIVPGEFGESGFGYGNSDRWRDSQHARGFECHGLGSASGDQLWRGRRKSESGAVAHNCERRDLRRLNSSSRPPPSRARLSPG